MDPHRGTGNYDRPAPDEHSDSTSDTTGNRTIEVVQSVENSATNAYISSDDISFTAASNAKLRAIESWKRAQSDGDGPKQSRSERAADIRMELERVRKEIKDSLSMIQNSSSAMQNSSSAKGQSPREVDLPKGSGTSSDSALETKRSKAQRKVMQILPETKTIGLANALIIFIHRGDVAMVRASLDAGATANAAEYRYIDALHASPARSQLEIVRLLLERRLDGLWYMLRNAIQSGYADLVKVMLDAGVDVSASEEWKYNIAQAAWEDNVPHRNTFSEVPRAFQKIERGNHKGYYPTIEEFVRAQGDDHIIFTIEWELHEFIREQLDGSYYLSNTLTVTGDLEMAYATTCEQYVRDEWGSVGLEVLEFLSYQNPSAEEFCPLMRIFPLGHKKRMSSQLIHILDRKNALSIIQTIAWMAAVFRLPGPGRPRCSRLSFDVRNRWLLRITLGNLEIETTKASHGCWYDLIPSTNIAIGFPKGEYAVPGLRLPFDLILDLTDAIHRTDLSDLNLHPRMPEPRPGQTFPLKGVFYNGVDSVIFPVEKMFKNDKTLILWHFDNSRTIPPADWNWIHGEDDFATAVHILGFTPEAEVHLGTPDRQEQYGRMSSSSALEERSRTDLELDGLSMTIGRPPFQFAVGGKIKYTRGQRVITNAEERTYDKIIRVAEKQPLILYDHGPKKIGWLVPQLSVILDLVHYQAYAGNQSTPEFAKLQPDGGAAAAEVLRKVEVANSTLYVSSDDGSEFKVKHFVKEIYVAMSKRRNADDITAHSTARFRHGILRGWDLLELLEPPDQSFRREFAIHSPSWLPLAERVPVYFGDNLGDIITSCLRPCCLKIWHDERLLVASVHALSNLHRATRGCGDFHLECGLVWECRKTKATISPRCREHRGINSDDEIRRIFHESVQVFVNGKSHTCSICIKDLSAIRHDGAVVFGSKANLATALWNSLINGND